MTTTKNAGNVGLPDRGNHRLAIGWPDDDRIDPLPDEIAYLADLAGHIAAGIEDDDIDVLVRVGGIF
ncbi:hypothetical protein FHR94_003933 [Halomonas cerina]|uniref:Uncharacterized protein n=1 Tax=Halomonas cerina TaxID=447424 RepID=A0A839VAX2_9GAMM|nr:hypothetical protein [Halomonas cerina]